MPQVGQGDATTRLQRTEHIVTTVFRGHVSAALAYQVRKDMEREVPRDMPEGLRPSIWVVNALQVTGFDGNDIRKPGGELLSYTRDVIAPHMILLRVENESVFKALGQAAVIMFARGICFGNGVKLHVLESMQHVGPYVNKLRKEGTLR
jgi:hypothetical protein